MVDIKLIKNSILFSGISISSFLFFQHKKRPIYNHKFLNNGNDYLCSINRNDEVYNFPHFAKSYRKSI